MSRVPLLVIVGLVGAGCPGGRADLCAQARDRMLPQLERNVRDAVAGVEASLRARLEAEGAKENAHFKARFVDVCVATPQLDLSCLDAPKSKTPECREMLRPVWKQIYRGP
jgi:hypothetical protein